MGKASRRKGDTKKTRPAPFARRPFEGMESETDLVAMREIVPAATATVTLREPVADVSSATLVTVLPLAWPGLRRADGEVLAGLQSGTSSGDASRDLAQVLLAAAETEPGSPVATLPLATEDTPRLQDVIDYQRTQRISRRTSLDALTAEAADAGLYDTVPDYTQALADARRQRSHP